MAGRSRAGPRVGPYSGVRPVVGLAISLALHALVFIGALTHLGAARDRSDTPAGAPAVKVLYIRPPEPEKSAPEPEPPSPNVDAPALLPPPVVAPDVPSLVEPITPREPASMAAPPAPTAAEWAFASTYKLKNSKGYRYTWGQQVRSMMGTAVAGTRVTEAMASGMSVVACENTMRNQKIGHDDMLPKIGYVAAGVVQLMARQKERYAYIRP